MGTMATMMDKSTHQDGEEHKQIDDESPTGAHKEQEGDDVDTTMLGSLGQAIASSLSLVKDEMQAIFIRLFSQIIVEKQVKDL